MPPHVGRFWRRWRPRASLDDRLDAAARIEDDETRQELIEQLVAELEPEPFREATLRGLIAPEVGPARFAALHAEAVAAESRCLSR